MTTIDVSREGAANRQRAATRQVIVDAAMCMLRQEPDIPLSHEAVAERAGVSARTVFRHFRTRHDLTGALWERLRDETGTRWPSTEAEIVPMIRGLFDQFEQHAALVRTSIISAANSGYPIHGSAEGRAAFRRSLAPLLETLQPADADRVVATAVAIYSAPFWQMLRDRGQLSAEDAREAAATAINAVIVSARARAAPASVAGSRVRAQRLKAKS
jgi:AcrR family transcriptional regulator